MTLIVWGIDGEWMVNIVPANIPFYPTDHCGVLRINTDDIIPEYLAIALKIKGDLEKFSRSNRASTQRIKKLLIEVPNKETQQKIVNEILSIVKEIKINTEILEKYDNDIKAKYIEMFENKNFRCRPLHELFTLQLGKTPSRNEPKYWNEKIFKWISISDMKNYDRVTSDTTEYISETAVKETGIKIVPKNTVIMSFKLTIGRTAITSEDIYTNEAIVAFLDKNEEVIELDYLRMFLLFNKWEDSQLNAVKGQTLNKKSIEKVLVPIPPAELQKEFATYIKDIYKLKSEIFSQKSILKAKQKMLIEENFK